ncbi:histidine--tRNA ligase [Candidatus Nomurabacteria bacterium]|nr:histidine--tRNA ligase [Candidatus Nomurabacteria bacterium]
MASNNKKGDGVPQSVKGMRDILDQEYYEMQGLFEKAQEIAMYYGFHPIDTPILEDETVFSKGGATEGTDLDKEMYRLTTKGRDKLALRAEGTAPVMRAYIEHGMKSKPQPVMLYYSGPIFRHDKPQRGRYRQHHQFGLEILGTEKPIADAIIIQTTMKILEEAGAKDLMVEINSVGDKESRKEYEKALKAFYRKHMNDLPAIDRQRVKDNILRVLDSKEPKTIEINQEAPESVNFLTTSAKKHFKAVLEYLNELEIPYRINKNLVRGLDYYTDTVFEVVEEIEDEEGNKRSLAICGGGRYNYLSKTMGHRREIPGVGVGIGMERVMQSTWWKNLTPRIIKTPKIYFIQLGFEAKLKSLAIVDHLRKAKIPTIQSLSKDKLSTQLAVAEKAGVPYVLIFGQREALDGTVIVRDMKDHKQKTVKIDDVVDYIKKLK